MQAEFGRVEGGGGWGVVKRIKVLIRMWNLLHAVSFIITQFFKVTHSILISRPISGSNGSYPILIL